MYLHVERVSDNTLYKRFMKLHKTDVIVTAHAFVIIFL